MIVRFGTYPGNLSHTRPIMDDQQPNISCYNDELRDMRRPTWYNVSWLYSECYLYRYSIS